MNKPEREGFVKDEPVEMKDVTPQHDTELDLPQDAPEWPLTIKLLHKPIQKSRTEMLHEITFREPNTLDIVRCGGNPCRIEIADVGGSRAVFNAVIDDRKMMTLMANLSGLLEPQIQKMDPRDYNSCAYRLRSFFLPEQGLF
jgi:hypothetical protein